MSDIFDQPDEAATPLTEEEKRDLKLAYITDRLELNAAEQENIARGQEWALRRRRNLLTENGVKSLHRHILGDVWRWAVSDQRAQHWDQPLGDSGAATRAARRRQDVDRDEGLFTR